jgi:hypothetical protein
VSMLLDNLAEHVQYLKELYEGETPHQYTIDDSPDDTMGT